MAGRLTRRNGRLSRCNRLKRLATATSSLACLAPGRRERRSLLDLNFALWVAGADFRRKRKATQQGIHGSHDVSMHSKALAMLNLDKHIEGRRSTALEDRLLRTAAARFLIGQGYGLDPADQVTERRIGQQVVEGLSMSGANQLHAALGNG